MRYRSLADFESLPDVRRLAVDLAERGASLRQIRLRSSREMARFCRDRGLSLSQDCFDEFVNRGWIKTDGEYVDGSPAFHPFRLYPVSNILRLCRGFRLLPSCFVKLTPERLGRLASSAARPAKTDLIESQSASLSKIVDLLALAEPAYWPRISERISVPFDSDRRTIESALADYTLRLGHIIRELDPEQWQAVHSQLRHAALEQDRNSELYLMLRVADWDLREQLTGKTSGGLWLRHAAEVLRRAFEEATEVRWLEEDQTGFYPPDSRRVLLGAERPLDDEYRARRFLSQKFYPATSSTVRWYVEGWTEYFALLEIFREPSRLGVELFNLKGAVASGRQNMALRLGELLESDREFERFSIISFDRDRQDNIKAVSKLIDDGAVIGRVVSHSPDFETANFSAVELVRIAVDLDEELRSDPLPQTLEWPDLEGMSHFEEIFARSFSRRPKTKNESWGRALARHALEYPERSDDGALRPLMEQVEFAFNCVGASYRYHKDTVVVDSSTFHNVPAERESP